MTDVIERTQTVEDDTPPYVQQVWLPGASGGTPVSADRLNHMEDGIAVADARALQSATGVDNAVQLATEANALASGEPALRNAAIALAVDGLATDADIANAVSGLATANALTTGLAAKANTTDVNTALALKANASDVTASLALKADATALATKADLQGGKVPISQLPSQALGGSGTYAVQVASQAAMLAITPPSSNTLVIAIRTDLPGHQFLLNPGLDATNLSNWIDSPSDASGAANAAQAAAEAFATTSITALNLKSASQHDASDFATPASVTSAINALSLGTASQHAATDFATPTSLANAIAALNLGTASTHAASDFATPASVTAAITALNLGSAATQNTSAFLAASALPQTNVPSYGPSGLLNRWDPRTSFYNAKNSNSHKYRAGLKKLMNGTADFNMVVLGDSTQIGYNGSTYNYDSNIPRQIGKAIARKIGASFGGGFHAGQAAAGNSVGDRWTLTGGFTYSTYAAFLTCAGSGTATWNSNDSGTAVDVFYSDNSTATSIGVTIDGVAQTPIVPTGTATIKVASFTGLSNGQHTVVITGAGSGAYTFIEGCRVYNPSIKQLYVHNLSLGGTYANGGSNVGANWSNTTATGLGTVGAQELTALQTKVSIDFAVIAIGNNDVNAGVAASTIATGIANMIAMLPAGTPILLIHPPKVPGSSDTIFTALGTQFFTLADAHDCMYFDWNDWDNTQTNYTADGLAGTDGVHPIFGEQFALGWHIAGVLCDFDLPVSPVRQIIEVGGVYPPRPNLAVCPAGYANYIGTDQPSDWVDGDTWDSHS